MSQLNETEADWLAGCRAVLRDMVYIGKATPEAKEAIEKMQAKGETDDVLKFESRRWWTVYNYILALEAGDKIPTITTIEFQEQMATLDPDPWMDEPADQELLDAFQEAHREEERKSK